MSSGVLPAATHAFRDAAPGNGNGLKLTCINATSSDGPFLMTFNGRRTQHTRLIDPQRAGAFAHDKSMARTFPCV